MAFPATSCRVGKGWQKVARWHLRRNVYLSYWRLLIYIIYTLENLAGHPLLAGTDTVIVVVFILHNVRIRRRPELVDGVAEYLLSPVPRCLGTVRF